MYRTRSALLVALGLLILAAGFLRPGVAQTGAGVLRLQVDSAIGPASADYIVKGIERASNENFSLLVVELDTPGGLDSAMRDIIKAFCRATCRSRSTYRRAARVRRVPAPIFCMQVTWPL